MVSLRSVLSAAALVLAGAFVFQACSKQGEAMRCEVANGNDDCDPGLYCVGRECCSDTICCPADRASATTPECRGAAATVTDSGTSETAADTGTTDAGTTDTGAADTGTADTGAADTGAADTGTTSDAADAD